MHHSIRGNSLRNGFERLHCKEFSWLSSCVYFANHYHYIKLILGILLLPSDLLLETSQEHIQQLRGPSETHCVGKKCCGNMRKYFYLSRYRLCDTASTELSNNRLIGIKNFPWWSEARPSFVLGILSSSFVPNMKMTFPILFHSLCRTAGLG